jgi:hypothetical protein
MCMIILFCRNCNIKILIFWRKVNVAKICTTTATTTTAAAAAAACAASAAIILLVLLLLLLQVTRFMRFRFARFHCNAT